MPSATLATFTCPWSSTSRASTPTASPTLTDRTTRRACRRGLAAVQRFCETCAAKLFSRARNIGAYFRGLHCETYASPAFLTFSADGRIK
jgi:hypothetical protein